MVRGRGNDWVDIRACAVLVNGSNEKYLGERR